MDLKTIYWSMIGIINGLIIIWALGAFVIGAILLLITFTSIILLSIGGHRIFHNVLHFCPLCGVYPVRQKSSTT